ncbi:hypothetical protein HPP92_006945 [Vanilla planifolia]|uniref:Uncharacterized protein n=1 Tax=Vanilla planifolia TaxID=51239 RepID=A0A835RG55_VANPL|nr:hypothetical protein HPP92_007180 [Vanilla planifolia]KAG0490082.1 hypothetical protein HPP92_006945 [Vanilla planifolia]
MWTDVACLFLSGLKGTGKTPTSDFGHVPWSPNHWALDVGWEEEVGFANAVRAVRKIGPLRKAELFGSLPRPSTLFASFLLLDFLVKCNARAPSFACVRHRRSPDVSLIPLLRFEGATLLLFFVDRAAFPHSTRPALFTNL